MADVNSVPSSETAQSNDQHPNEQTVPVNLLPIVEYSSQDDVFGISDELFREWSDDEQHADTKTVPSVQRNDQQQNKPTVSNGNTSTIF